MSVLEAAERELLQSVLDAVQQLPNGLRQKLSESLWASIPTAVLESAYAQNWLPGAALLANAQTGGLEVIRSIVAVVPSGCTGLLQLGSSVTIPLSPGLSTIAPVQIQLGTSDLRALTLAGGSGPAALVLMGDQLPTYGVMSQ